MISGNLNATSRDWSLSVSTLDWTQQAFFSFNLDSDGYKLDRSGRW